MTQEMIEVAERLVNQSKGTGKKIKKRFRARHIVQMLTDADRFKQEELADGSLMICENTIGVVAIWSPQYRAIVMERVKDKLEDAKAAFIQKKLERSAQMPVFTFSEQVFTPLGESVIFLGHEDEYRLTSIVKSDNDDTQVWPTDQLTKASDDGELG